MSRWRFSGSEAFIFLSVSHTLGVHTHTHRRRCGVGVRHLPTKTAVSGSWLLRRNPGIAVTFKPSLLSFPFFPRAGRLVLLLRTQAASCNVPPHSGI